ncbi:hypothetical protein QTG54_005278 [Skeletonema marinoi]|uniref:Uncharacterized protein n=1 Tax=Skeletonema marinoi TaxID=267567 RepID=A0AAD9DDI9_9STRA|nr:hypothetical protein QTG54_005278 [Skeletonema marinoi]
MRRQSQASAGISSGGSTPVISNHNNLTGDRRVSNLSQGGNLDAINEQKPVDIGVVNIPSSQLQRQQQQQQQQMDPGSGCDRCVQMESAILSLQADIEYVRTLELQKEFVCRECESGPAPPAQSVSSAVSLGSRVKQSHYERAYWQNDMHLKLEKFAMMCKNLNEDAAQRSNEVKELTSKLEKVTSERNGLVSQVETLKARVGLYEGESVVQSRLRDNFEKGEAGALDLFDKAMKGRDETIEDLSNRLAAALEELSEKAKLSLEASMVQSSEREKALQSQLDVLEQELEQARAILQDTDDHYLEAQLSMKHTSSNSSL